MYNFVSVQLCCKYTFFNKEYISMISVPISMCYILLNKTGIFSKTDFRQLSILAVIANIQGVYVIYTIYVYDLFIYVMLCYDLWFDYNCPFLNEGKTTNKFFALYQQTTYVVVGVLLQFDLYL